MVSTAFPPFPSSATVQLLSSVAALTIGLRSRAAQAERAGLDRHMIEMIDRHRVTERRHLGLDVADQPVQLHGLDRILRRDRQLQILKSPMRALVRGCRLRRSDPKPNGYRKLSEQISVSDG